MNTAILYTFSYATSAILKRLSTTYGCYTKLLKDRLQLLLLPLELLGEIAGHLPWLDLLYLRLTCKLLCDVSKLRSVRVRLVDRAIASDPYGTPLERPIGRYSGEELERWALQRLSVEQGWISDQRDVIHPRHILFKTSMTKLLDARCLITGGRWLLAVLRGGIVMAVDLENPDASQQMLIQPQDEFDKSIALGLFFSIVDGEATLTFDLALLHGGRSGIPDRADRLSVWRVVLSDDGANLSANHINSFWTKSFPSYASETFSLSGNHLARASTNEAPEVSSLEIIDWRLSTSNLHHKAAFRLQPQTPSRVLLELIPGNRAVVVSEEYLWIYAIPELQASEELSVTNPDGLTAIHAIPLCGGRLDGLSRPRMEPHRTLFALYTGCFIFRLSVPHDIDSAPILSSLGKFESHRGYKNIGLNRGLVHLEGSLVRALCYSKGLAGTYTEDCSAVTRQYSFEGLDPRFMRPILMDEGSGRIVEPYNSGKALVFDLSPYKLIY